MLYMDLKYPKYMTVSGRNVGMRDKGYDGVYNEKKTHVS